MLAKSGVKHILCCFALFCLRLVFCVPNVASVSLGCLFPIAPSLLSNIYQQNEVIHCYNFISLYAAHDVITYTIYPYTVENIHFIFTSSRTGRKKQALGKLFWSVSQRVQINFIFTDDVRIMCFYCNIKKSRRTAKLSEKSRNKHDSNGVFYHVRTYSVPFLTVALNESGTSKTL